MSSLWPFLLKYRTRFLLGFLFIVIGSFTNLLPVLVVKCAVDAIVQKVSVRTLLCYSGLLVGVAMLKGLVMYGMQYFVNSASLLVERDLRRGLFERLLRQSASYFDRNMTGDLMSRAASDVHTVRMMLGPGLISAGNTVVIFVIVIVMLVMVAPLLTLLTLAPTALAAAWSWYCGAKIRELHERSQQALSEVATRAHENFSGVRVVRSYVQEDAEVKGFREVSSAYMGHSLRLARLWALYNPALDLLVGVSLLAILWQGGLQVARGVIQLGTYVALNSLIILLAWPLIALGRVLDLVQRGLASMARIDKILQEPPEIHDGPEARSLALRGDVEFRNLSFAYSGVPVLHDINLRIRAGEIVGITGPTGCGKSTLVGLLARLYEAPPDTIYVDGVSVRALSLESLRSQIAFAPQDGLLFSDTIYENVAVGAAAASAADVGKAVEISQLAGQVETFPAGLETVVGERGLQLSGGQRQRTSLSRALVRDAPILILDDSLSSVDTETEARILDRLIAVMRGRTTLLISHRISSVALADRVLVLDQGRIVEEGTPQALLVAGRLYAELFSRQLLQQELERMGEG